jgi:hypothetical protein
MCATSTDQSKARFALAFLWRSLVVAVGYAVALTIGGMISQALRLPMPSMAADVDLNQIVVLEFVSGLLLGLTMGPLSLRLRIPGWQRAILLFALLLVLNSFINAVEAQFFTTAPFAGLRVGLVTPFVGHVALALLLVALFRPASVDRGLVSALRDALGRRRCPSWVWRFLLGTVVERDVPVEAFEVAAAPLEDIFIAVVRERHNA